MASFVPSSVCKSFNFGLSYAYQYDNRQVLTLNVVLFLVCNWCNNFIITIDVWIKERALFWKILLQFLILLLFYILFTFLSIVDILRPVLCSCQPIQETSHLHWESYRTLQRQKAPWGTSTCFCYHRHSIQEHASRCV